MIDGLPTGVYVAGEVEGAGGAIHAEDGDRVAALIAAVEEPARRVEGETARIVPARPFLADERQAAVGADGEDPDAVVQPVARVDEPPVGGDQDLGAEIAAGKSGRQGGDRLPRASSVPTRRRSRTARWSSLPPGSNRASGRWDGNGNAAVRLRAASETDGGSFGASTPRWSSNFQTKILSSPRST